MQFDYLISATFSFSVYFFYFCFFSFETFFCYLISTFKKKKENLLITELWVPPEVSHLVDGERFRRVHQIFYESPHKLARSILPRGVREYDDGDPTVRERSVGGNGGDSAKEFIFSEFGMGFRSREVDTWVVLSRPLTGNFFSFLNYFLINTL